jgi:predicted molibdopterin-dependent oxidoreductase YjgC
MTTEPLFAPLARAGMNPGASVTINVNGRDIEAIEGASLAASLLAAGITRFRRSPVSGDGRAAYCMMGVCFECLVEVNGVPNRQSCLVTVQPGMVIRTQDDVPDLALQSEASR